MKKTVLNAMNKTGALYSLFSDHLGSAGVSYRSDGLQTTVQRYKPWGVVSLFTALSLVQFVNENLLGVR